MIRKFLSIFCFVMIFTLTARADDLTATLSQDKVPLGETFELILKYNGADAGSVQPDFSPLYKDFSVYSTSSSMQSSFVNGRGSVERQWKIGLMPKNVGVLTVPEIKAGRYTSEPLHIQVLPAGSTVSTNTNTSQGGQNAIAAAANNLPQVEVNLSVDDKNPYVQQEINAVLTINDNKGIEFASEPQLITGNDDWIIKNLRQPTVEANGKGGRIIKFYYALFPQKSGRQQIPTFQTDGFYTSYEERGMPNSAFGGMMHFFDMDVSGMFGVKKPIKLLSKPIDIDVKPIAADYGNNWWLPATAVGVASRWVDDKPVFKVGETVAREVVFAAEGVADTQLPEIELQQTADIRQYPEKPEIDAIADHNKITSQIKMRIVYIPQVGGEQTIPEIRIPWFNVNTGKKEIAVIDAVKVNVSGTSMPNIEAKTTTNGTAKSSDTADEESLINIPAMEKTMTGFVQWIWVLLAFAAGLLFSFVLLRQKGQTNGTSDNADLSSVAQALHQKDYRQLRDNLLGFGRKIFARQNINNLNDLAALVDDEEFTKQIQLLNGILYANQPAEIDDKIILEALKKCHKTSAKKETKPLPDLYK